MASRSYVAPNAPLRQRAEPRLQPSDHERFAEMQIKYEERMRRAASLLTVRVTLLHNATTFEFCNVDDDAESWADVVCRSLTEHHSHLVRHTRSCHGQVAASSQFELNKIRASMRCACGEFEAKAFLVKRGGD